jgi:hypothetical protein
MNAPMLEDRIFTAVIQRSNLLSSPIQQDKTAAQAAINFYNSLDPFYKKAINGAFTLGEDTYHLIRTTEGETRLRHLVRMMGNTAIRNEDHITGRNVGMYVFKMLLNIVHDDAEETFRESLHKLEQEKRPITDTQQQDSMRRAIIRDAEDGLNNIITVAAFASGRGYNDALFNNIPASAVIRQFHNSMAPGFKAKGLGNKSYVSVMDLICKHDKNDDASLIAALLRADVKLYDRQDDITHLFPSSDEFQEAVANTALREHYAQLRSGRKTKEELKAFYKKLKAEGTHKVLDNEDIPLHEISSAKRTEAAWKVLFAYNPIAQLLDETTQHDNPLVRNLRKPLARSLPATLRELNTVAERLSLFLVNYHNLSRRDRLDEGGAKFPANDAALYDRLNDLATKYAKTPGFFELQGERGTEGLEMFKGSTAHMARVEMKDKSLHAFDRDYFDHLVLNVTAGKIARTFYRPARTYTHKLNAGAEPKTAELLYFPDQSKVLTELINK